jgi:histone-lysine N-methyltransferase SETMAR
MDQQTIVLYLRRKGLSRKAIRADLEATLGSEAVSYSSVAKYIHDALCEEPYRITPPPDPEPEFDDSDKAILSALADQPFASVRELARLTHLPKTTVHRRLTQSLGFRVRNLRWVPHILSTLQQRQRITLSNQLLSILTKQQRRSWIDIVTLDESWFYLHTDHERIWLQPDEPVPERERHTVQSEKMMLTIVWNPNGFHHIDVLPKGLKFNASYYVTHILEPLRNWREAQPDTGNQKLIIHADNARPHTAKMTLEFLVQNGMERAPHPPYSPDLAPSDFYLFGYIKHLLRGHEFANRDELFQAVSDIVANIENTKLDEVFHSWMDRLHYCANGTGGYVD